MEYEAEYPFALPIIITALALVLATLLLKLRSGGGKPQAEVVEEDKEKVTETLEKEEEERIQEEAADVTEVTDETDSGKIPVEEIGAREEPPLEEAKEPEPVQSPANQTRTPSQSSQEEDDSKEEDELEPEGDKVLKISEADDADDEDSAFKYHPGKMRGSEFQKIFTKDELDEEQRSEDDMKFPLDTS
ncbi:matrix-remodelling associated 7 S homeolog isoform X1 [Xenopus laevis]|uniref:Matrix-remodelling associated 7 S homeolog isoform X1 n=1 Tax=Xenopus laevis TaxID=8355 RepID=A0A8J0TZ93_XENLA|nr:matrix-remodelling associated 7 S homeolog isoform X1 [Xenopus laevis]